MVRDQSSIGSLLLLILFIISGSGDLFAQEADKEHVLPEKKRKQFLKYAEQRRGLKLRYDIPIRVMPRDVLRKRMEKEINEFLPVEEAQKWGRTLKAFGLFPKDRSLKEAIWNFLSSQVGGFYDDRTKELYLVAESESSDDDNEGQGGGVMGQMAGMRNEIVSVHELTHAIQDQRFDLGTLPMEMEHNDDVIQATKALVEGDASYVQYDHLLSKRGMNLQMASRMIKGRLKRTYTRAGSSLGRNSDTPLFLRKSFIFPYTAGFVFIIEGRKNGWKKINKIYSDLPASTEQILHPEKYFENRDYPVFLSLPSLKKILGSGWSEQSRNNFGEYGTHLLFLEFFKDDPQAVEVARTGWDGDMYLSYFNKERKKTGLCWFTTWDSKKDAKEFFKQYRNVLDKKYPEGTLLENKSTVYRMKNGDDGIYLKRKEKDVLVIEQFPRKKIQSIANHLWTQTERRVVKHLPREDETSIAFAEKEINLSHPNSNFTWTVPRKKSIRYEEEEGVLYGFQNKKTGVVSLELMKDVDSEETLQSLGTDVLRRAKQDVSSWEVVDRIKQEGDDNGQARIWIVRGKKDDLGSFKLRIALYKKGSEILVSKYISTRSSYPEGLDEIVDLETSIKKSK